MNKFKDFEQAMETLRLIFASFDETERQIMLMRYGLLTGHAETFDTIGKKVGYTRQNVHKIVSKANTSIQGFLNGLNVNLK